MRIGTPTPEQIEAAAKALYCTVRAVGVRDFEEWPEYVSSDKYRAEALAALVAAAGVTPQEPAGQAWLVLLMPDSGAHKTREWRGVSASEDDAIERAMNDNPGWSVHTFGPDVNARPGPVQVDEAKLAEIVRRVDSHEWSRMGGSQGEQVADIVRAVLRGGGQ